MNKNDVLLLSMFLGSKLHKVTGKVDEEDLVKLVALAFELEGAAINQDTLAVWDISKYGGDYQTILLDKLGFFIKSKESASHLFTKFEIEQGIVFRQAFRNTFNYFTGTKHQLQGYVTPRYTFSRITKESSINLNLVVGYQSLKGKGGGTLIHFSNGLSIRLNIGVQSVRNTVLNDSLESMALKNIFSIPIDVSANTYLMGRNITPYTTNLMKSVIKNKEHLMMTAKLEQFMKVLNLYTNHLPMFKNGNFEEMDYDLLDSVSIHNFKNILTKEALTNGEL